MMQGVGYADGEAKAEQSLSEAEHPDIVVPAEEPTGNNAPYQRGSSKSKIRHMCAGKQKSGQHNCARTTQADPEETFHEVVLQEKLLVDGPENVAGHVPEAGLIKRVQRANFRGDQEAHERQSCRRGQDPERPRQATRAEAKIVAARAPDQHDRQGCDQRDRRKN